MEDVTNRIAKEMADAIAAAIADNPAVEECRERARQSGFELKVSLEAVVGFMTRIEKPRRPTTALVVAEKQAFEVTANDRRFLRSLRIAQTESAEATDE